MNPSISVSVATYEWPEALARVLAALAAQTRPPDEVIVTDDGSGPATRDAIAHAAADFPVPLRHLWQPDDGFRLARARNRAVAAARGEFIIQLDGDMVPHPKFVADFARAAERGWFVQGTRLFAGPKATRALLDGRVAGLGVTSRDVRRRRNAVRSRLLNRLVGREIRDPTRLIKGCSMGYWRADFIAVNGFDERMVGWGREDNDLAARLLHSGIRGRYLRHLALAVHLERERRESPATSPNDPLLAATLASRSTRAALGVDRYLAEFEAASLPDLREGCAGR